jgi:hypothetical protein
MNALVLLPICHRVFIEMGRPPSNRVEPTLTSISPPPGKVALSDIAEMCSGALRFSRYARSSARNGPRSCNAVCTRCRCRVLCRRGRHPGECHNCKECGRRRPCRGTRMLPDPALPSPGPANLASAGSAGRRRPSREVQREESARCPAKHRQSHCLLEECRAERAGNESRARLAR